MNAARTLVATLSVLVPALATGAALADVVHLKNGQKFEGAAEEKDGNVVLRLERGSLTFPKADVERIEKCPPPWEEYEQKARELKREDVSGHMELARWCKEHGLARQVKLELEQVVAADPENAEARKLLGHRKVGDKWLSPEEARLAQEAAQGTKAPSGGASGSTALPDGTYTGRSRGYIDDVEVEVVVTLGKISDVKVVGHKENTKKAEVAVKSVPARIIDQQSVQVDGVSSATATSNAIKRAAAAALASARPVAIGALPDGTYTGLSRGYRGDVAVQLVVKGGRIVEAGVTRQQDTKPEAIEAVRKVPIRIKSAQGVQVDAVTGATVTSQAIMRAAQDALDRAAAAAAGK